MSKLQNATVYLLLAAVWIVLLELEQLATIILQITQPFLNYHVLAIALALTALVILPRFGNATIVRDLREICWYDVFVQVFGGVIFLLDGKLFWYGVLANTILYMKWTRILWSEKSSSGAMTPWPRFGGGKVVACQMYPHVLPFWTKMRGYVAIMLCFVVGVAHQLYFVKVGLLVPLCITVVIVIIFAKPLITHLETQQEQLRTTMEELGAARVRAELAEVMAAQAAELAAKNEEMNRLNLELERLNQELGVRNDDLMVANCAIDAQNVELARQSRVVAQANHDIMPLMMMIHELTQLAMEVDTTERQHEILRQVIDCNATMGERMERLIGVQRIKMHKARSIFSAVHLSEVIDMLDLPFCRMAEKRGGSFAVKGSYHRKVWSNAEYLDRIISNLIKNAIVHNPPGTHVRLLVTMRRNVCIIRVLDNGKGIPEAGGIRQYQNFTDLVQRIAARANLPAGDAAEVVAEANHGIGLQSVAALCEELGLKLRLYSRFQLGAIFEIGLELAA